MVRRILGWVVLVPLSLVLIVFALANRQLTVVNFNPLVPPEALSAPGIGMPLFLVIFGVLLAGVVMGGFAAWLAQGPVRRDKRRWQREAERLGRELEAQRRVRNPAGTNQTLLDVDDLVDSN
jgi:uncharacterized integral membrane protein